jgi:hypothetical protein
VCGQKKSEFDETVMLLKTMRIFLIASAALLCASLAIAQAQGGLKLMPMPSLVQTGTGQLPVDRSFSIVIAGYKDATLERGVRRFAAELSRETGMLLKQKPVDLGNPTLLVNSVHGNERVTCSKKRETKQRWPAKA